MTSRRSRYALVVLLAGVLVALSAGCGDDPISYSQPVGITTGVQSKDVSAGALALSKNINTENGNPYGAFVNAAKDRLGGKTPSRIAVTSATLALLPGASGVTDLQEIFTGNVGVAFQMNGSLISYPVAQASGPSGTGPVAMTVSFDPASMSPADYADLVQGSFKVALTGTSAPGFAAASANASLQTTFGFTAYE
jgi:hypothetical protein